MISRRHLLSSVAAAGAVGAAAACSPSASSGDDDEKTLTFRLWDDSAKAAYEESFAAFTNASGWKVTIESIAWADYWKKLPLDVGSDDGPDVFWMNSANYVQFQEAGKLVNIQEIDPDAISGWEESVVELYTRADGLWGVPQLWDSIALFYNRSLTDAAGVDPAQLAFDPSAPSDALREAGKLLTLDGAGRHPGEDGFDAGSRTQFGFNSQADRQAIIGPFLASNGAEWERDDRYVFASEQGIAAFQYLSDLINVDQIAPSAGDTNAEGDFTKDLFTQGKLGLYQSGPYSLSGIAEGVGDSFEWSLAPLVKGPAGGKSVIHGVVACGNAKATKKKKEGITALLKHLGTVEGQKPLGARGVAFPGAKDAQSSFVEYWQGKGVDVQVFIDAAKETTPADTGSKANAGLTAAMPIFQEIFIGRKSAAEGLPEAQEAGNKAME